VLSVNASASPVMIAYDGSDAAKQAISAAAELFAGRPAYVVTVWEPGLAYAMSDMEPTGPELSPIPMDISGAQELEDDLQVHARRTAAEGAGLAKSAGLDCEALVVADRVSVAEALVQVADKQSVAAIVVGSRGLTGLRARLEGSTSSAILKHASVPVVVVHND
jgi:nucleotide-binding universal stress UspA family protein